MTGTTSKFGKPRLTMAGVEERYKIKGTTVLGWLNNYRKSQIQSAIDIVNGMYILYNNRLMYVYIFFEKCCEKYGIIYLFIS